LLKKPRDVSGIPEALPPGVPPITVHRKETTMTTQSTRSESLRAPYVSGNGVAPKVLILGGGERANDDKERHRVIRLSKALGGWGFAALPKIANTGESLAATLRNEAPDIVLSTFLEFPSGNGDVFSETIRSGAVWIGATAQSLRLARDKSAMKTLWSQGGLCTPEWMVVSREVDGGLRGIERLDAFTRFPYIVKPLRGGNSRGIGEDSVAQNQLELLAKASVVANEFGAALVERFVSGGAGSREFTATLVGSAQRGLIGVVELSKRDGRGGLITEGEKDEETIVARPVGDGPLSRRISKAARRAFILADSRDYARCDFLLHEGRLYAIEVNGQPMIPDPWFEAGARASGLASTAYVSAIVMAGAYRAARTGLAFVPIPSGLEEALGAEIVARIA
jgi:D-alanine-D-alanine ligase-like ATP-grasp enzyme